MKSRFLTELLHTPLDDDGYAELTQRLMYWSVKANGVIEAETGFRTNFVTGRKLLFVRRIVQDKMNAAAVIHDKLYSCGTHSRAMADSIFYEAMRVSGVAAWRASLAYAAVRACGWQFYGGPAEQNESMAP